MNENLKPTPENINKDKIKQIERNFSFDVLAPKDSGIPDFIKQYKIRVEEKLDEEILGVINQITSENGFKNKTEIVINRDFVLNAMKKATAQRPTEGECDDGLTMHCPSCCDVIVPKYSPYFCRWCGQKLKWSDEDE